MDRFRFLSKSKMKNLPETTGVYLLASPKPAGEGGLNILYIGKAINIKNRVKNHFLQPSYRGNLFIDRINKIGFFETDSEIEALILETNLIKKYQPKYNVMWRDDKNYFYVAVLQNKQGIPYVFVTHQPNAKLKAKSWKLKADYIGPFTEGVALKKTLRFLRRALPYYTSARHPKNKCAYCHLDLCPGRPATLGEPRPVGAGPYLNLPDYKKNIKKLILILRGEKNAALNSLKKEMKQLAKEKKFEKAGKTRDRLFALQRIMAHAHIINNIKPTFGNKCAYAHLLPKVLRIQSPVSRIECYDISNTQGKQATGSMVVFINGKPDKNQYRKFRIKMKNEPNDVAMLKEVLIRRFNHPEWNYPDAILIDGGKAQLNIAIKVKEEVKEQFHRIVPMVISIAKGKQDPLRPQSEARLFIENKKNPIPLKSLPREVYNLIKQLDDEAHRFAISYHRKLRSKKLLNR